MTSFARGLARAYVWRCFVHSRSLLRSLGAWAPGFLAEGSLCDWPFSGLLKMNCIFWCWIHYTETFLHAPFMRWSCTIRAFHMHHYCGLAAPSPPAYSDGLPCLQNMLLDHFLWWIFCLLIGHALFSENSTTKNSYLPLAVLIVCLLSRLCR